MNDKHQQPFSLLTRCAAGFWAASLLFFLIYSTPHSVHHVFEQHSVAGHDDSTHRHGKGQQNKAANNSDCVFQISVSRCAVGLTAQLHWLAPTDLIRGLVLDEHVRHHTQFLSNTFPIRAPPTV